MFGSSNMIVNAIKSLERQICCLRDEISGGDVAIEIDNSLGNGTATLGGNGTTATPLFVNANIPAPPATIYSASGLVTSNRVVNISGVTMSFSDVIGGSKFEVNLIGGGDSPRLLVDNTIGSENIYLGVAGITGAPNLAITQATTLLKGQIGIVALSTNVTIDGATADIQLQTAGDTKVTIANGGAVILKSLIGTGVRAVVTAADGTLSAATGTATTVLHGNGTFSAIATGDVANSAVTYAKIQNVTTARLLGRATAAAGVMEEITLGTTLAFTGTTLNANSAIPLTGYVPTASTAVVATDTVAQGFSKLFQRIFTHTASGDGVLVLFTVAHGAASPTMVSVTANSEDATDGAFWAVINGANVEIHYPAGTPPSTGTNNLSWTIIVK